MVTAHAWAADYIVGVDPGCTTIQDAIDTAHTGDVVIVPVGLYHESLDFKGKGITVTGTNPDDPGIVAQTIIQGTDIGSVVRFTQGEFWDSVLTGLTITRGTGMPSEGRLYGAGIYCRESSPTISLNVIKENGVANPEEASALYGGGIACVRSLAVIQNNQIQGNEAHAGGGIYMSRGFAEVRDNVIIHNQARTGGGVYAERGWLVNNTLYGNGLLPGGTATGGNLVLLSGAQSVNNIVCCARSGGGIYIPETDVLDSMLEYNNIWGNVPVDMVTGSSAHLLETMGNISENPLFVYPEGNDFHLRVGSPCVDAGSSQGLVPGERDLDGDSRLFGAEVDMGADEYTGAMKAHAGPDQSHSQPQLITLDGRRSLFTDPNAQQLFFWTQVSGPAVDLTDPHTAQPRFLAISAGSYGFDLVVGNGIALSTSDEVLITIMDHPPIARCESPIAWADLPDRIELDGRGSSDPDHDALSFVWTQIEGPTITLLGAHTAEPNFVPVALGIYVFELKVSDGWLTSEPATAVVVIGNSLPVAHAGSTRYAASAAVRLDGTLSYDPDGDTLTYDWQQTGGASVPIFEAHTAQPWVGGFGLTGQIETYTFELTVMDTHLPSPPATVQVKVVPHEPRPLDLVNPPFDSAKPSIVNFGGGNCVTGSKMSFNSPALWEDSANVFAIQYEPPYDSYADWLIVYLSQIAPDYAQPIQTMGFSTGGMPALDTALRLNCVYGDPRFAVNRILFLDAACRDYSTNIERLIQENLTGEACWIANHYATSGRYYDHTLNIDFPNTGHSSPRNWVRDSPDPELWQGDFYNNGVTAGYYVSVIGPARNLQMPVDTSVYYFECLSATARPTQRDRAQYPGRLPEPVTLMPPKRRAHSQAVLLSCYPSHHAVYYELLAGTHPTNVNTYELWAEADEPPGYALEAPPQPGWWWTVRAHDAYGATIYADPVPVPLLEDWPVQNTATGEAYALLQHAIDDATDGDILLMGPGVYEESIQIDGKHLTLQPEGPADEENAPVVLRGHRDAPVVTLSGNTTATLHGLRIAGGRVGILIQEAKPSIESCTITGNDQAGIEIQGNSGCIISYCDIRYNGEDGVMASGVATRNRRRGKTLLDHTVVAGNGRYGVWGSHLDLVNCTIVENGAAGVWGIGSQVSNSIVFANDLGKIAPQQLMQGITVTYSNVQAGFPGEGNINEAPEFVHSGLNSAGRQGRDIQVSGSGDYHLKSEAGHWDTSAQQWITDPVTSPCIDAGDPAVNAQNEPQPNGSRINMGAYGGSKQASRSK